MISLALICIAAMGWLTHEPSPDAHRRRRIKQLKRERLRMNPALRKRR